MKRIKVSKWRKMKIRKWLTMTDHIKDMHCPFYESSKKVKDAFCKSWFPKIHIIKRWASTCPCHEYKLNYIIRTAKIMLKS